MWTQARARRYSLDDIVTWMSTRPARITGLTGKGSIAAGGDADLVAFAPDETFTVDPERLYHRHKLTPYAGQRLRGVVRRAWLRGQPLHAAPPGQTQPGPAQPAAPAGTLVTRGVAGRPAESDGPSR